MQSFASSHPYDVARVGYVFHFGLIVCCCGPSPRHVLSIGYPILTSRYCIEHNAGAQGRGGKIMHTLA